MRLTRAATLLATLCAGTAHAAEVVWLSPPADALRVRVAEQAGASGPALAPIDLRVAATRWSAADDDAYASLEATLREVRGYETKLDGELVIMRDLMTPISAVGAIRNDGDRDKLYGALAYQGFAVNRYFDTSLATDEAAAPYRMEFQGLAIERPWFDAVALDPTRQITQYDVAEAPQRVAYGKVAEMVAAALPASIVPADLPAGATLKIDGRTAAVGASGNVKVVPGRHLVHAEIDGRIAARWDLHLDVGQQAELAIPVNDAAWTGFLDGLSDGGTVPDGVKPMVEAMGGEVWIARPDGDTAVVFAVRPSGVAAVEIAKPPPPPKEGDDGLSVALGAQGGWFYSADFFLQEPTAENHDDGTVNAGAIALLAAADFRAGLFAAGVGVQSWVTLGADHFALSGSRSWRIRPYPHIAVGVKYLQATGGFLFPYHPAAGARATLPLGDTFEIQASGLFGFPGKVAYKQAGVPAYRRGTVRTLNAGVGLRF